MNVMECVLKTHTCQLCR